MSLAEEQPFKEWKQAGEPGGTAAPAAPPAAAAPRRKRKLLIAGGIALACVAVGLAVGLGVYYGTGERN